VNGKEDGGTGFGAEGGEFGGEFVVSHDGGNVLRDEFAELFALSGRAVEEEALVGRDGGANGDVGGVGGGAVFDERTEARGGVVVHIQQLKQAGIIEEFAT